MLVFFGFSRKKLDSFVIYFFFKSSATVSVDVCTFEIAVVVIGPQVKK